MESKNPSVCAPQQRSRARRWALLAVAAWAVTGCGHLSGRPEPATPPGGGGFSISPESFAAGMDGPQGALCTGHTGVAAACVPRPQVNFNLRELGLKPLRDVNVLPPADQPKWVLCRLDYRKKPPVWECAEIYDRLPR
jgi:hypothetical protein